MLILLLESDRLLAENVVRSLSSSGHKLMHVVEPEAAITACESKLPQLVIMDLQLAGHSGAEFLYEFKSYPEWANIPVIILSNLPQNEAKNYLEVFHQLDIKHYFYKPQTSLAQLTEAVAQLVPVES